MRIRRHALFGLFFLAGTPLSSQVRSRDSLDGTPFPSSQLPPPPPSTLKAQPVKSLPPGYWATGMRRGQVAIIDGVISAVEPGLGRERVLVAGIPMASQPSFDIAPIPYDSTRDAQMRIARQGEQLREYLAQYLGRNLPSARRNALASLYRAVADTANSLRDRPPSSAADYDAQRRALARLLGSALARERVLFAGVPAAERDRYGTSWRPKGAAADLARRLTVRATTFLMHEDADARRPSRAGESRSSRPARITGLQPFSRDSTNEATDTSKTGKYVVACAGEDTIVTQRLILWQPLHVYEARIYIATHGVSDDAEFLFMDTPIEDDFFHSSLGAGIWQQSKQWDVTETRLLQTDCTRTFAVSQHPAIQSDQFVDQLADQSTLLSSDTITSWRWFPTGWDIANGGSGTYLRTDDMTLVKRAVFQDYAAASRYLFTPEPDAGGVYRRMHAASYSVGDFGLNWICQTDINAFTAMRWGVTYVNTSVAMLYLLYGNRGISNPSFYGKVIKGCVPGQRCFYNQIPFATSIPETKGNLEGWGYGLETFWAPGKNSWWNSDADFNRETPPWPTYEDPISKAPGAQ